MKNCYSYNNSYSLDNNHHLVIINSFYNFFPLKNNAHQTEKVKLCVLYFMFSLCTNLIAVHQFFATIITIFTISVFPFFAIYANVFLYVR